jgi:hypothetical protein
MKRLLHATKSDKRSTLLSCGRLAWVMALLVFTTGVTAQSWTKVRENGSLEYDQKSAMFQKRKWKVWTRAVYPGGISWYGKSVQAPPMKVSVVMALWELDCEARTEQRLAVRALPDLNSDFVVDRRGPEAPDFVTPGSPLESLLQRLCASR